MPHRLEPSTVSGPALPAARRAQRVVAAISRRLSTLRRDEATVVGLVLAAVLAYLVVLPTLLLARSSVTVQFVDSVVLGRRAGSLTLHYLWSVFASGLAEYTFWQPLEHTLVTSVGACAVAVVIGGGLAWCVTRFDFFLRRSLSSWILLPFAVPSWAVAQAWLTTFHNHAFGGSPGVLEGLGIEPPVWLGAGPLPIIVVLGAHLSPFVYLLTSNGLGAIGAELEEAVTVLGGRRRTVLRRVTGPLLLPSLGASGALVFAHVLGDFGTAYLLGLPLHYNTLATSLYANLRIDNMGVVAVIATTIVVIGCAAVAFEARLSSRPSRFTTRRLSVAPLPRRPARRSRAIALTTIATFFVAIAGGMPLFVLAASTVSVVPGRLAWSNLTLRYWTGGHLNGYPLFPHGLLRGGALFSAAWSSVRIMGIAALICGALGIAVGYVVTRSRVRPLRSAVRQLSFMPYLIPGISLAAAYIVLFAVHRGPLPALYGTLALIIVAMVVLHLPYSSRSAISAFTQTGREAEEAARITGASWWRTIVRIVAPMQLRPFITGVALAFVSGLKELNVVVMLSISSAGLLTTLFFELTGAGYTQLANGVAVVIVVVSLAAYALFRRIGRFDLASSMGGASATRRTR